MDPTSKASHTLVEVQDQGRVLEATLANPPDNRLTPQLLDDLDRALDRFEDPQFEVLVVQGSKASFSKGFDVATLGTAPDPLELRKLLVLSNAVFSRLARSPKPTIAAISGACLGGGFELALACHFRLCAERSRLGLPEVWIKLVPGLGGVYRLTRLIGAAKALEMVALGDLISADDALRLNVVNRVFPKNDFSDRTKSFVDALLMAKPEVMKEALHLVSSATFLGEEDNIRLGIESFARLALSWNNAN